MINKIKQTFSNAGDLIKDQASALGEAAKQKGFSLIDDWITILPILKSYGLETTFFSLSVSINPTLDIELLGEAEKFTVEYIDNLLEKNKLSTPLNLVFSSIKTTYRLYDRSDLGTLNPLVVRIKVRFSPEIRVSYGEQTCE